MLKVELTARNAVDYQGYGTLRGVFIPRSFQPLTLAIISTYSNQTDNYRIVSVNLLMGFTEEY
jgi:hypothetical protein